MNIIEKRCDNYINDVKTTDKDFFESLPTELIEKIFLGLDSRRDFINTTSVCKRFYRISQLNSLWKHFFCDLLSPLPVGLADNSMKNAKDYCMNVLNLKKRIKDWDVVAKEIKCKKIYNISYINLKESFDIDNYIKNSNGIYSFLDASDNCVFFQDKKCQVSVFNVAKNHLELLPEKERWGSIKDDLFVTIEQKQNQNYDLNIRSVKDSKIKKVVENIGVISQIEDVRLESDSVVSIRTGDSHLFFSLKNGSFLTVNNNILEVFSFYKDLFFVENENKISIYDSKTWDEIKCEPFKGKTYWSLKNGYFSMYAGKSFRVWEIKEQEKIKKFWSFEQLSPELFPCSPKAYKKHELISNYLVFHQKQGQEIDFFNLKSKTTTAIANEDGCAGKRCRIMHSVCIVARLMWKSDIKIFDLVSGEQIRIINCPEDEKEA